MICLAPPAPPVQAVRDLPRRPTLPPQRWQELARCGELVNLKLLMLLMHQVGVGVGEGGRVNWMGGGVGGVRGEVQVQSWGV